MTTSKSGPYPRLAIACQGGGAITAFQAGVLGELLKHSRRDGARTLIDLRDLAAPTAHKTYELIAFSGTSGGAMNASACWVACALNDPAKAGDRLAKFWQAMTARACDPTVMGYWFNAIQRLTTQLATGWWQADFDPEVWPLAWWTQDHFKALIAEHIGIDTIRNSNAPALYVGSAEVRSGTFALFARNSTAKHRDAAGEVTAATLAASAAIPWLYPAVPAPLAGWQRKDIDEAADWRSHEGDADTSAEWEQARQNHHGTYWDGLFSQNPPLWPLLKGREPSLKAHEILVLRANPRVIPDAPRSAAEVDDRRNELQGNLSMEQEILAIDAINKCARLAGPALARHYHEVRVWELDLPWRLHRNLRAVDKLRRDESFIAGLIDEGANLAREFLAGVIHAEERTGRRPGALPD